MNDLSNPTYPIASNLFKEKKVVVTASAGAGIGFATAKRFLEEGAEIFISDANEQRLQKAHDELTDLNLGKVHSCVCDVTSTSNVDQMMEEAMRSMSNLDVVVNNAGLGGEDLVSEMSDETWNKIIDITLNGTMRVTRAGINKLKECDGGVIVNNASVLGWRAQVGQAHYAAAKAGVMALTRCAALEVVDDNIRINAVAPSLAINPHLAKTSSVELIDSLTQKEAFSRGAHPWEIANIILFLASNLSSYMTGETISASSQRA